MSDPEIYLDYAATSPVDPAVTAAMLDCLQHEFGNPSSQHAAGRRARALVEAARAAVAARVGAPRRSDCCSRPGATEANNLALKGMLPAAAPRARASRHVAHRAQVGAGCGASARGSKASRSRTSGRCRRQRRPSARRRAIRARDDARLDHARQQRDRRDPGRERDRLVVPRARRAVFTSTRRRASASCRCELGSAPIDLCSLTAHKLCGPKGVGALYVAPTPCSRPQLHGGEQERGLRAGTQATHQIVGMGRAYELADARSRRRGSPRCATAVAASSRLSPVCARTVPRPRRAPHLLNVTFPGVDGESLRFALRGVAVSAGSACAADSPEASHVLTGMGLSDTLAGSSLRFSVGRFTTRSRGRAGGRHGGGGGEPAAFASRNRAPAWCSGSGF